MTVILALQPRKRRTTLHDRDGLATLDLQFLRGHERLTRDASKGNQTVRLRANPTQLLGYDLRLFDSILEQSTSSFAVLHSACGLIVG